MSELHILNGDCAWELWKNCDFPAQSLIWREIYLEGPLPETGDLQLFRQARARYLAAFAELSGIDEIQLCKHLQAMDDSIIALPENSTVMLWFDSCIFDQTILMRILYLIDLKKSERLNVFLYCCNTNCLTANDFQCGMAKRIRLHKHDWQTAAQAWQLLVSKDAGRMKQFAEQGNFERLLAMQKALMRCAEELPGPDGLNRTQHQILKLVAGGNHSFMEIFKKLSSFEEYPFLGDTACQRHLDFLTANKFLTIKNNEYYLP